MSVKKLPVKPATPTRDRWTVLDVDQVAIKKVRKYAKKYNLTTGSALSEIIKQALADHE